MHVRQFLPELVEAFGLFLVNVKSLSVSEPHQLFIVAGEPRPLQGGLLVSQEDILGCIG